jgi:hypothetical protein
MQPKLIKALVDMLLMLQKQDISSLRGIWKWNCHLNIILLSIYATP